MQLTTTFILLASALVNTVLVSAIPHQLNRHEIRGGSKTITKSSGCGGGCDCNDGGDNSTATGDDRSYGQGGSSSSSNPPTRSSSASYSGATGSSSTGSSNSSTSTSTSSGSGNSNSSDVKGAVYFTTNHPDGNTVIAADIGSNGQITFTKGVATGGKGAHADDGGMNGPDVTFSNGLLRAHAGAGLLAAANFASHTISLFRINPDAPSDIELINSVDSGAEFPISVTFNKAGDRLCALNTGPRAGLLCFTVDPYNGIEAINHTFREYNLNQTSPPVVENSASVVSFTENEDYLVVAIKGNTSFGNLLAYTTDGTLDTLAENFTEVGEPAGFTYSLTQIPGRNSFLSADPNIGLDLFDFSSGNATIAANSSLTGALNVTGQITVCWTAYSAVTDRFYASDDTANRISEISVNSTGFPKLIGSYDSDPVGGNNDIETADIDGKGFLYTLLTNATSVEVWSLEPGNATIVQSESVVDFASKNNIPISSDIFQGLTTYVRPS